MTRPTFSRLVVAGALATLLTLAGSAPAQAADLANPRHVLDWLGHLWDTGLSALWSSTGAAPPDSTTAPGGPGSGIDPSSSTTPGDQGPGIDPNGG